MKIYTKTGDKGTTALFGGMRVPKHHIRIESYGTIDELNSFVGLLRSENLPESSQTELERIQNELFTLGSHLAATPGKKNLWVPEFTEESVTLLETEMDAMDAELPELKNFILPVGNKAVALTHVCRTICRRGERMIVLLAETEEIEEIIPRYMNRLSDYFFMLGRWIALQNKVKEVPWTPRNNSKD